MYFSLFTWTSEHDHLYSKWSSWWRIDRVMKMNRTEHDDNDDIRSIRTIKRVSYNSVNMFIFKVSTLYYHIWYAYINRVNIMNIMNQYLVFRTHPSILDPPTYLNPLTYFVLTHLSILGYCIHCIHHSLSIQYSWWTWCSNTNMVTN